MAVNKRIRRVEVVHGPNRRMREGKMPNVRCRMPNANIATSDTFGIRH
jgi:hypothetical protein